MRSGANELVTWLRERGAKSREDCADAGLALR